MAEITPLRFKKDTSWEGENELPEYYTDVDKRADLLKFLGAPDGKGGYIFDSAKWEEQREKYKTLLEELHKAQDDYDNWVKEQNEQGKKKEEYEEDKKYKELEAAKIAKEGEYNKIPEEQLIFLERNEPKTSLNLLKVYEEVKGDEALEKKFTDLEHIVYKMLDGDWRPEEKKNDINLQYKDGQLLLRVDNLGGSGLKFAIKDDLSIVFTENQTLTKDQVQKFAEFFDEMGMSIEDFSPTQKLKVVDDKDSGKEVGTFEDIFKSYSRAAWRDIPLDELRRIQEENEKKGISNKALDAVIAQKTVEEEYAGQDYDANGQTGQTGEIGGADTPSHEGNPFADYLKEKDKDISLRKMKEKILARAGIMRINRRCITTRRMPDGSMVISFYGSEQDKMNDGKLDKDGIAKHTKKCAFRMWNTRPPRIGIYVPQGAKFETGYAKGALSALKGCGYNYFFMPSAAEFGGDAQKAFWEAAGDQLMCPLLKSKDNPNGCDIGNDHLQVILKAIKDKGADDEQDVLLYKMRLIGQLQKYKEYKESRGEKFSSELDDSMKMLEGDVRMHFFNSSVLSDLNKLISEGAQRKGWDAIDVACAYKAVGIITEAVKKGELTYINAEGKKETVKYDYLNPGNNTQIIRKIFAQQMGEARPEVEKEFKKLVSPGSEDYNEEEDRDDSEGHRDKILQQKDFDKASRDIVNNYSDALHKEGGAFAGVTAAYPKSEVCQKLSVFKPSSVPSVKINDETRTVTDEKGKTKKELVNPWKRLNQKDVPDLSHVASNAKQDYARGRARASSPTQARGGNTGR